MALMVRAIKPGYYGHRRRYPADAQHKNAGQPFELEKAADFSNSWMEWVNGQVAVPAKSRVAEPVPTTEPTGDQEVI